MKRSVTVMLFATTLVATVCIATATHAQAIAAHKTGAAFTCPVHREVRSPRLGTCPRCAMDLMPVMKAEIPGGVTVGQTFRHRFDGKVWADGAPKEWTLHDGVNSLEVLSVNKFGIEGAPSKVVIDVGVPKTSNTFTVGGRKVTIVERDVTPRHAIQTPRVIALALKATRSPI